MSIKTIFVTLEHFWLKNIFEGQKFSLFLEPSEDPHDLRLVGGETESSGRLEVWYGGVWGTVCSVGWDMDDAEVACRQLGFHGALTLLGDDTIPEGAGLVWLEGVGCRGNESRLTECDLMGWGLSQCDHTQDIGLMCDGERERERIDCTSQQRSFTCRFSGPSATDHTPSHLHTLPQHLSTNAPPTSLFITK